VSAPAARRVVVLAGATATGKTALGEAIAAALGGEVVCADSRQVYAGLEIGTGKPTRAERAARPHHLFDALALGERASAGWYVGACAGAREAIHARGRTPVLVGGSGLYLRAARLGLAEEPPHDPALRARLREACAVAGPEALHARLAMVDPPTAARLHPRDGQRVTRALEVYEASGRPLSWWHARSAPAASTGERWIVFELVVEPHRLNRRIRERSEAMFASGLVEETRALIESGAGTALRELQAIGYDEAIAVIEDQLSVPRAITHTSLRTRQLAKRQRTWFRHQVEAVRLEAGAATTDELLEAVLATLAVGATGTDSG
jgi:tRNA dimethylallyltransferase